MRTSKPFRLLGLLLVLAACSSPEGEGVRVGARDGANGPSAMTEVTPPPWTSPTTRTEDQVDIYHGTRIEDPYRWLEDPDVPAVREWIEAQNRATEAFLSSIPERETIRRRLTELWDYPRYSPPSHRAGRYFYSRNDGLQDHAVVHWTQGLEGEPRLLLDPNTFSEDRSVALAGLEPSDNGRLVAYAKSSGGSDWNTWHVRDVASGRDLEDVLKWVKFSEVAWLPDGSGFYYSRYPEPEPGEELTQANYHHKLYFHRIGTPQASDVLVYERPDEPEWGFGSEVTDDGRYLVIPSWVGTDRRNRVFYLDLQDPAREVRPLLVDFDASYDFVGNDGPVFYFKTDAGAPRGRLVAIDLRSPGRDEWRVILPESPDTISEVRMVADRFVVLAMHDVHHRLTIHERDGTKVREVPLPGLGTIGALTGRRSDQEMFFLFTTFAAPPAIHRYDFRDGTTTLYRRSEVKCDPSRYVTGQQWYTSKDGTRIPMYVVHRKDVVKDGARPTYLYGYGGFNIPMMPYFSVANLVWLEMGGIFAVPALRGGGEYGEEWHAAGMLERKQNVFDDFIAAAEHLIAAGYTSPERLASGGGSNGGLLVGACMNQRPDLFGACLPAVGVMDMLRFHRFTIGWAWVSEYGSADDPEQFQTLLRYSPLHNIRASTRYPATLITTADHDDRVVPAHSFKFAAALQAAQAGPAPILLRIETRVGHGAGMPTSKLIEEAADRWAFLVKVFGIEVD